MARLAFLVWILWVGLVGLIFGMLRLRVWGPSVLPVALFALLLVACLTLLAAGGWRVIRGPGRVQAICVLLIGLAPPWFLAGHLMYGFRLAHSRQLDLNLPLKTLMPLGESILDFLTRFTYPMRTQGERVVMISARMPLETARQQVAAMDRHIKQLESRLGRTGKQRVYWVRGPIMEIHARALNAVCLASPAGEPTTDPDGLSNLDRHEVAHIVVNQFCTVDTDPPAVLSEGWAMAQSGIDRKAMILNGCACAYTGRSYSLAELVGPQWYGRHERPAYAQGGPLVDYILRRLGPIDSCRSIRPVAERPLTMIAGASWACPSTSSTRTAGRKSRGTPAVVVARYWLSSLALGPDVDPGDWQAFVSDYFAASERMLAPYDHVRLTAERVYSSTEAGGKTSSFTRRLEFKRSGPLRALRAIDRNGEEVYLATPEHSFRAERQAGGDAWKILRIPTCRASNCIAGCSRKLTRVSPLPAAPPP